MRTTVCLVWVVLLAWGVFVELGLCKDVAGFERRTPVVEAYEKTHEAIVNISGERTISRSALGGFAWPEMFDMFGPRIKSQVMVLGSGAVVHEKGYVVTNAHVVKGATKIKIGFSDGKEYAAKVVKADDEKDIAILQVEAEKDFPVVELGSSSDLMPGETVLAIGNPYGYANTITTGVVSAIGRDIKVTEKFWLRGLIQTDAPINPGNSGGPLLNINGKLIGITTAIRAEAQNIGFAIPVDSLVDNLSQMLMPEKMRRASLGLVIGKTTKVNDTKGVVVDSVNTTGPAGRNGIEPGDVIVKLNGEQLSGIIDFYVHLMDKAMGEPIEVTYIRPKESDQKSRKTRLTLKAKPLPDGRKFVRSFFHMQLSELTEKVAREFDFDGAHPVLIVTHVIPSGTADRAGIEEGDIILQVNNRAVSNMKELSLEMEKVSEGSVVEFRIVRISMGFFGQVQRQFIVRLQAGRSKVRANSAEPRALKKIKSAISTSQ